jgi:hypothetical protein
MQNVRVPEALAERLGEPAAAGLVEMFSAHGDDVTALAVDRFERRLVEETSKLRVEMAQLGSDLRVEMAQLGSDLRRDMGQLGSDLRGEIAQLGSDLRGETALLRGDMHGQIGGLRGEIAGIRHEVAAQLATHRFELLKWAFLFWVGQLAGVAAIVGLMLRVVVR